MKGDIGKSGIVGNLITISFANKFNNKNLFLNGKIIKSNEIYSQCKYINGKYYLEIDIDELESFINASVKYIHINLVNQKDD